jgi:hypothetical protein
MRFRLILATAATVALSMPLAASAAKPIKNGDYADAKGTSTGFHVNKAGTAIDKINIGMYKCSAIPWAPKGKPRIPITPAGKFSFRGLAQNVINKPAGKLVLTGTFLTPKLVSMTITHIKGACTEKKTFRLKWFKPSS